MLHKHNYPKAEHLTSQLIYASVVWETKAIKKSAHISATRVGRVSIKPTGLDLVMNWF